MGDVDALDHVDIVPLARRLRIVGVEGVKDTPMREPLMNTWRTWSGIAFLVVVTTKTMGASTWSWTLTLFVGGVLGLSSLLLNLILRFLRKTPTGPADGGDVSLVPGRGARGGKDGTLILVADPTAAVPTMRLTWRSEVGHDECEPGVDFYVARGSRPNSAREGSLLLALDEGRVYQWSGSEWRQPGV